MAATASVKFAVDGKVAIVTGAGSGINYEFAKILLENNCSVVIGDLSLRPEAQALLDQYQTQPRAIFQKTDVTNWTDLNKLFSRTVEIFNTFEIVCPGAGVFEPPFSNFFQPPGSPGSASKDPTDGHGHYATMDINVTHPIRATQLALAEFLSPTKSGTKASPANPKRIVHVASVAAQAATLHTPLYYASKHALDGFVRSLGELEELIGVRVNAICPGLVKTPLWTDHPEKLKGISDDQDTWISPQEIAQMMLRLVQDDEYTGGDMVEVGADGTRKVPMFGNEGPRGLGFTMSKGSEIIADNLKQLSTPGWGKM
ncbi:hypothetical protein FH972_025241 [Carpinus fangiana]|uniref:NAD-dependent epimerase/dehydratase domain-containing protein n=1 Tax=Carpinus fangiana TaxID=176857 RepID=A0A5N6L0G0_9ROSI|nr:hypothetical protein FH972_025241 [Carpinus fangiana]